MELEGKVAIVTGGARRLGKALALSLAERGARLVIHYGSSVGPADETVAQIKALGSDAVAIQGDFRQPSRAPELIVHAAQHFGQLDILVNSAAIFEAGDVFSTTEDIWDRHVGRERPGHIVNITDWRATRPGTDHLAYTLTKAALVTMTKSLALALAPNIQVNAIAPGAILPPPDKDQAYLLQLAQSIPAQRIGSPAEVAKALLFLLESDFVTGDLVFVTGGEHL
jgi:pteridine reductase